MRPLLRLWAWEGSCDASLRAPGRSTTSATRRVTGAFWSDGIYLDVNGSDVGLGVWEATGPTTAAMMFTETDDDGNTFTVRASVTVDGDSLSADYTLEVVGEGAPAGEYGPGQVTGTRVAAEPMGTPVGSLDELFGGFEEGTEAVEGTAMTEATEVAAPPTTS